MSAWRAPLRTLQSWQVTLGGALLALGFLIAVQLQTEAPRVRYSSQERPPLVETVQQLQDTQDALKARILESRRRIGEVQQAAAGNDRLVALLNEQLKAARITAGLVSLAGPGIVVQLSDSTKSPTDDAPGDLLVRASDLRDVVNELWLAGAEAVSVNGERVAATTGFTDIATSVLLNGAYLQAPYQISAIGPPELETRLTSSPGFVAFVAERVDAFGLDLRIARPTEVIVPAYAGNVELVETRTLVEASPSATGGRP